MTAQATYLLIWLGTGLTGFGIAAGLVRHMRRAGGQPLVTPRELTADGTTPTPTIAPSQQLAS